MNILLVAYYFPPLNCAGAVRPWQMARGLRLHGHAVFVLTHGYGKTAEPEPGIIRVHDPAFARRHRGVNFFPWLFWRAWAELQNYGGRYASVFSPWRRAVSRRADEIFRVCRPDLIMVSYPPLEVLEIGLDLANRFHVPLVGDFRDGLLFRSIETKRLAAHRCVREKYAQTEKAIAAATDMIVAVTPVLSDYFAGRYPGRRCETVFNGYDEAEWRDLPAPSLARGYFHIVHTGRIALSDSAAEIGPLLVAVRQAGRARLRAPFRIHLIGEYSRREMSLLKDLIGSGVVAVHPLLDRREALAFQKAADLLLLVTRPGVRSGIPLKLFEYIFSGRPVLALSDDAEVRKVVRDSGSGWCASPRDNEAIAELLVRILSDPVFYRSLKRNPENVGNFSWARQMMALDRLLASLSFSQPPYQPKR
jgi:glycosyltransferase involved in cell wall biosynthesis